MVLTLNILKEMPTFWLAIESVKFERVTIIIYRDIVRKVMPVHLSKLISNCLRAFN